MPGSHLRQPQECGYQVLGCRREGVFLAREVELLRYAKPLELMLYMGRSRLP